VDLGSAAVRLVPQAHRTVAANVLEEHAGFRHCASHLLERGAAVELAQALAANKLLRQAAARGVEPGTPARPLPPMSRPSSSVAAPPVPTMVVERELSDVTRSLLDCKFRPAPVVAAGEAAGVCAGADNPTPTISQHSSSFGLNAEQHSVFVVWAAAVLDRKLRAVSEKDLPATVDLGSVGNIRRPTTGCVVLRWRRWMWQELCAQSLVEFAKSSMLGAICVCSPILAVQLRKLVRYVQQCTTA